VDYDEWHPHPDQCYFLPLSALAGDNVVGHSRNMGWFSGPSLLEYLETVETGAQAAAIDQPFRFPVQRVIRPNQDFRGYAGQICSGTVRPGDEVCALPSGRHSRIKTITTFNGDLEAAFAPMSVTLTLEDELDLSRGDMLAHADRPLGAAAHFETRLVWLNQTPLDVARRYLLKHTTQLVSARVTAPQRIDVHTLASEPADALSMNDIATVEIETSKPLFFDPYERNRATGSLVLIDLETNATVAAGMIVRAAAAHAVRPTGPVTPAERRARYGHRAATILVGPRESLATLVERRLFDRGCAAVVLRNATEDGLRALEAAGVIAIATGADGPELPEDDARAAEFIVTRLFEADQNFEEGGGI
jgi:sulfate adenylyltransferase subunit 1 (EFTu-like GTPase family)